MGTHADWTENLVAEINSMHQSRADSLAALRTDTGELLAQFQKENELRKVGVSELLSDARDLVTEFRHEHQQRASELRESLGEFGGDVRAAADMWLGGSKHSTRERSRPEEPGERQAKQGKKKGKQG